MMLCCASCAFVSSPNSSQAKVPRATEIGIGGKRGGFIESEKALTHHGTQVPTDVYHLNIARSRNRSRGANNCDSSAMPSPSNADCASTFLFPLVNPGTRISKQVFR